MLEGVAIMLHPRGFATVSRVFDPRGAEAEASFSSGWPRQLSKRVWSYMNDIIL